jgi:hypothetical protein
VHSTTCRWRWPSAPWRGSACGTTDSNGEPLNASTEYGQETPPNSPLSPHKPISLPLPPSPSRLRVSQPSQSAPSEHAAFQHAPFYYLLFTIYYFQSHRPPPHLTHPRTPCTSPPSSAGNAISACQPSKTVPALSLPHRSTFHQASATPHSQDDSNERTRHPDRHIADAIRLRHGGSPQRLWRAHSSRRRAT